MTFSDCVRTCAATPGLVVEFDRLTGHQLSGMGNRAPLDAVIDEATGRDRMAAVDFLNFVWDFVWTRVPVALVERGP